VLRQTRLAGALEALKRSRSADDGQDALIHMLQNMLQGAVQRQQQVLQGGRGVGNGSRGSSAGNLWQQQQQQASLQQVRVPQLDTCSGEASR